TMASATAVAELPAESPASVDSANCENDQAGGTYGGSLVAIKIYDKELLDGENAAQQTAELERIRRQLCIKGHGHPNIVQTLSAGKCERTGYHYIIMEYVADQTLDVLLNEIPRDAISHVFQ